MRMQKFVPISKVELSSIKMNTCFGKLNVHLNANNKTKKPETIQENVNFTLQWTLQLGLYDLNIKN